MSNQDEILKKLNEKEEKRKSSVIGRMISTNNEHTNSSTIIIEPTIKEVRSKRINLLTKPSIYEKSMDKAKSLNLSLNEVINQFLEKWTEE